MIYSEVFCLCLEVCLHDYESVEVGMFTVSKTSVCCFLYSNTQFIQDKNRNTLALYHWSIAQWWKELLFVP